MLVAFRRARHRAQLQGIVNRHPLPAVRFEERVRGMGNDER